MDRAGDGARSGTPSSEAGLVGPSPTRSPGRASRATAGREPRFRCLQDEGIAQEVGMARILSCTAVVAAVVCGGCLLDELSPAGDSPDSDSIPTDDAALIAACEDAVT